MLKKIMITFSLFILLITMNSYAAAKTCFVIKDVTKLHEAIVISKNFKPKEFKTETNNIINIVEDFINNN